MTDASRGEIEEPLVGRTSIVEFVLTAALGLGFTVFAARELTVANTIQIAAMWGAGVGFLLGARVMSRVSVFSDRVVLVNWLRTYNIARSAILRLDTVSGIYIEVVDHQPIQVAAFQPTLGKRFVRNRRAQKFGVAMSERLRLDELPANPDTTPRSGDTGVTVTHSARLIWVMAGSIALYCCIGMLARLA